jgi:hypothetical protein
MPLPPTVELVCSFTTVKTAPLSPFVWALLKTLKTFPEGSRPEFNELAEKLAFKDTQYLNDAWTEVTKFKLCERGEGQKDEPIDNRSYLRSFTAEKVDYDYAKITEAGLAAINGGAIQIEAPRKRSGEALYFTLRDGSPITVWKSHYEPKGIGKLDRPKWAEAITENLIIKALGFQRESGDEHIQPDEQLLDLEIHWDESRRVKLD